MSLGADSDWTLSPMAGMALSLRCIESSRCPGMSIWTQAQLCVPPPGLIGFPEWCVASPGPGLTSIKKEEAYLLPEGVNSEGQAPASQER